ALLPDPSQPILNSGSIGDTIWGNFVGVASFDSHSSSLVPRNLVNPLANGSGVSVSSSNNRIGGTFPSQRNVIQGNTSAGVVISGVTGTGNVVEGDYILDNLGDGVLIATSNNYVGEPIGAGPAAAGNIISGNLNGVHIQTDPLQPNVLAQGNNIVNNEIGTDVGLAGVVHP